MATPIKPVDFENMLIEIRTLREKYSMPKGIILIPDKLEISVQRISYDNFNLSYKEFFNYLPNPMLDLVIPTTINMLVQIGIPRELITRIDGNGIGMEISGDFFQIMGVILSELLIQKRLEDDEIYSLFNFVQKLRKSFVDFSEFEYEWNSEIENRFYGSLENLFRIMQEHPSVLDELEAIIKKYTQPSENPESGDKQNTPESKM